MKTQIIHLEPHDDIISTRDKMGWGKTRRILLVWPTRGRILTRKLDLQLLLRQAQTAGEQLALVTYDPDVLFNASQLGIPVFESTRQAQDTRWRNPRRRRSWRLKTDKKKTRSISGEDEEPLDEPVSLRDTRPQTTAPAMHSAARLTIFTIGVLAFLSIASVLIPSAEIALTPQVKTQEMTINVTASSTADQVYITGLVPIHSVNVIVEGQDRLETTGTILIPERPARGEVRFTNLTNHSVTIPAGTIVSTPGSELRFATDRAGSVPAGPGENLTLPVTALQPGSGSKLAAGRITAIESPLGVSLTVTNPSPTVDGSDLPSPAPSESDRLQLTAQLESDLQHSAISEIEESLAQEDLLLSSIPTLVQTLEKNFKPANFQPASLLSLNLQLEFKSQVTSGDDINSLAASILNANLPSGYTPIPNTMEIEHLTSPTSDETSNFNWSFTARQKIKAQPSEIQAAQLALGITPSEAGERLYNDLPLATQPEIFLRPSWWPRLPFIPFRVSVDIIKLTP